MKLTGLHGDAANREEARRPFAPSFAAPALPSEAVAAPAPQCMKELHAFMAATAERSRCPRLVARSAEKSCFF